MNLLYLNMLTQLFKTVEFIKKRIDYAPEFGIVLGTGLSGLVKDIEVEYELMYSNIPDFPTSTLEFHSGKLLFGKLGGRKIVAMSGRLHYYEGYSMQQITLPIRVLAMLGIRAIFLSNAGGSLNPEFKKGELMILEDHINMLPDNPLRGRHQDEYGPRFPDMSQPYSPELIERALKIAASYNIPLHKGVYVSVPGPNLETRAEYRYLRMIGADVVGMSTVPEVIVACQMGLPVFAMSVLTDECDPANLKPVSIDEIIATAAAAEPDMTLIMKELISSFGR